MTDCFRIEQRSLEKREKNICRRQITIGPHTNHVSSFEEPWVYVYKRPRGLTPYLSSLIGNNRGPLCILSHNSGTWFRSILWLQEHLLLINNISVKAIRTEFRVCSVLVTNQAKRNTFHFGTSSYPDSQNPNPTPIKRSIPTPNCSISCPTHSAARIFASVAACSDMTTAPAIKFVKASSRLCHHQL